MAAREHLPLSLWRMSGEELSLHTAAASVIRARDYEGTGILISVRWDRKHSKLHKSHRRTLPVYRLATPHINKGL
jgi:hypothetical protein